MTLRNPLGHRWPAMPGVLVPLVAAAIVVQFIQPSAAEQVRRQAEIAPLALSVQQAADRAVAQTPMLRMAGADIASAWARVRALRAERKLSATLHIAGTFGRNMPMTIIGGMAMPDDMYPVMDGPAGHAAVRLSYPFWTGGRMEGMEDEAWHNALAVVADASEMKLEVALTTKLACRQIMLAQAMEQILGQKVAVLEEQLRIDRARLDAGRLAEVDVLRQEAALANAKAERAEASGMVAMALADLKSMLVLDQASAVYIDEGLTRPRVESGQSQLSVLARSHRPAMNAAEERLLAAHGALEAAEGSHRPTAGLFGVAGVDGSAAGVVPQAAAGVALSVPITTGGRSSALEDEADAMIAKMTDEREQLGIEIDREIAALLAQLSVAQEQLDLADVGIAAADEAYEVTRFKYEQGRTTLVDVLDALAMRTEAHLMRAMAAFRALATTDRLTREVGAGDVVTVGEPIAIGWAELSLWRGESGEVILTAHDVTVDDLLVWLSREQGITLGIGDPAAREVALSGAFRGLSVDEAVLQALNAASLKIGPGGLVQSR